MVVPDLNALVIAHAPPIQAGQLEREADQRVDRVPVLDVKEIETLPEDLSLVIALDTQPLPRVKTSEPLLQLVQDIIVHQVTAKSYQICLTKHAVIAAFFFVGFVRPTCNRRAQFGSCDTHQRPCRGRGDGYRISMSRKREIDMLHLPYEIRRQGAPERARGSKDMTAIPLHNVKQPNTYSNTHTHSFPRRIRARVFSLSTP